MFLNEIPELSHFFDYNDRSYYVTTSGVVGILFESYPINLEDRDVLDVLTQYQGIFKEMPDNIRYWINLNHQVSHASQGECARSDAFGRLGYKTITLKIALECQMKSRSLFQILKKINPQIEQTAEHIQTYIHSNPSFFGALTCATKDVVASLFQKPKYHYPRATYLETDSKYVSIIRLVKPTEAELFFESFAHVFAYTPHDFKVITKIKKIPGNKGLYLLNMRQSQEASSGENAKRIKLRETTHALDKVTLQGSSLFEVEYMVVIENPSIDTLKQQTARLHTLLSRMAEFHIESFGIVNSYPALFLGSDMHAGFKEQEDTLPYYLPVYGYSNSSTTPSLRSLTLHTRDLSKLEFDLFDKSHLAYTCVINGKTGSGKSVLANLLSKSLLNSPHTKMIKVDVGGSYEKECSLYGGQQIDFNINSPSGLNPFSILSDQNNLQSKLQILSNLVSTLVMESDETILPKSVQAEIEESLKSYAKNLASHGGIGLSPNISDYYESAKDFSRRPLLKRWTSDGIFQNAFEAIDSPSSNSSLEPKYIYFNFKEISQAAQSDYAQAIMAAVIAYVNYEVIKANSAATPKQIVFFCDETPFFIKRNAEFFKFTTANFRKYGHACILIAQQITDFLIRTETGQIDDGILRNSLIRFLYQIDGNHELFAQYLDLPETDLTKILSLTRSNHTRQALLQYQTTDGARSRVVNISLTPEEYWEVTTTRKDNEKLGLLLKQIPGLSIKEAISCLALH